MSFLKLENKRAEYFLPRKGERGANNIYACE
jgi:hypothetical protein